MKVGIVDKTVQKLNKRIHERGLSRLYVVSQPASLIREICVFSGNYSVGGL